METCNETHPEYAKNRLLTRLRDRGIGGNVPLSPLIFIPRSAAGIIGAGKPGSPRSPLGPVRPGGP